MAERGRATYVVDIETVGVPWDSLDETTRTYLLTRGRDAKGTPPEPEAVKARLNFSPGTGRVVVIAGLNLEQGAGGVFVEGESRGGWTDGGPSGFRVFVGDERALLAEFWKLVAKAGRIVTFNGRQFDGPFLMLRSAMLGVPPSRQLAGYRYSVDQHCDLQELLSFHGAWDQRFSLDYWCRRFGITSPKAEGLDGSRVQEYYDAGRIEEIAAYCVRDVVATGELYGKLAPTLLPLFTRES